MAPFSVYIERGQITTSMNLSYAAFQLSYRTSLQSRVGGAQLPVYVPFYVSVVMELG